MEGRVGKDGMPGPRVRIRYTPTKSRSDDGLEACSADALAIIESCSAR
jgi:hypothetical protein